MAKAFRSVSEVLSHVWPASDSSRRELTDRVLRSTKLEDAIYMDMRKDDESMEQIEAAAIQKLRTFPALSRDVFQSFYSISPRRRGEGELSAAARKFNSRILTHVTGQDDYPALKDICEGRELLAYEAASEFTERAARALDELLSEFGGDKGSLNVLEKLEQSRDKSLNQLISLLRQRSDASEPSPALEKKLLVAANQAESKRRQAEALSKMIDSAFLRRSGQVTEAVVSALDAAKKRADEAKNIIGAWSDNPGELSRSELNLALLARVRSSPKLRDISKYLGRFREIFAHGRKNGYTYGRGETYSLELGSDISRALTSELSMLASPASIPLFIRKYRNKQLKLYRRREAVKKGMGDIICCLDESGSTRGEAEAWGKAAALTLLELAERQGRRFAMVHFSGPGSFRTDLFLPRSFTWEDKLRAAETFLGGGTDFETPLSEAMQLMDEQGFENADIVFVTDGNCALSASFCEQLREAQAAKRFTITGILLDSGAASDFSLQSFCGKIYHTSELCGDEIVRSLIRDRL